MSSRIAIVCSAHGFGHLTRQLALAERMRARGVEPVIFTAAPEAVVHGTLPGAVVRPWVVDVGIAQRDSVTEDLDATLERLERRCAAPEIERLARALEPFERVIVDVAPPALEACRRAGVEAVAVGNFDWAWIYSQYPRLSAWAERFAAWQAPHLGASLWPGPGLRGFARVERFGLIGRSRPPHSGARGRVLVSFGGFGLRDLEQRLPRLEGLRWLLAPPMARPSREDCDYVEGVPYPALVAGAELVLTKPGYGIFAEACLGGTRLAWIPRGAFPEAPWIEAAMKARGDRPLGEDLAEGVRAALASPAPAPVTIHERERLADWLLGDPSVSPPPPVDPLPVLSPPTP
ncbi:MAG: hypothetical protein H6741_15935 [Alphaproteobacteria bacterium]|nr:hypothetical protein [Alphaproteobacteria bacterium]